MKNSEKIRQMLKAGKKPKQIATELQCPIQTVYSVSSKMKKEARKKLVKKIGITLKKEAPVKQPPKHTPLSDFILEEMVNIEHQINRLNVIRSFLSLRLQQVEQNGE